MGARIETAIARLTQRLFAPPEGRRRRRVDRAGPHGRRAGALDLVSARRASGDGSDVFGGGGAGGVGDAGGRGETISASRRRPPARRRRSRRPGGRSPCGWRAAFTVWWRSAAWCASPICATIPDRRSVAVRGDRRRAAHRRIGARRARRGLVADAVSRRRRGRRAASSTSQPTTSCSTTARTSRSGSRSRAAC